MIGYNNEIARGSVFVPFHANFRMILLLRAFVKTWFPLKSIFKQDYFFFTIIRTLVENIKMFFLIHTHIFDYWCKNKILFILSFG